MSKRIKKKREKKAAEMLTRLEQGRIKEIKRITSTIDGVTPLKPIQQNAIMDALEAGIVLEAGAM